MKARRTPFAMVPLWVYDHPDVTPTVLQVYVAMAALAWGNAGRQPMAKIMERCGLKKSATYAAVAVLEGIGALEREDGDRDAWYLPTDPDSATMESAGDESTTTDDRSATTETDSATTESHLLLLETPQDTKTTTDAFDAFWHHYPRKTAKGDARKAWPAAVKAAGGNDAVAVIVQGAQRYANDPNRLDQFTAHPATWLRAERWNDEPLPSRTQAANGRAVPRPIDTDRAAPSGRITL